MTKRPAQPTSRIAKMRVASAEQKSSTVDKVRVDPRVAALVVQTYEALSPKNRKLFAQLPTKQMVATAMKLQAAKAKPAKLQKKADAGNGVVYFVIHINDDNIEYDRDSDDAEERARYDEFLDEDKDLTSAAMGAELAMLRYVEAIVRKVLPGARIGNEGHDNYGDLVCKFSVNSTEDLLKVKDVIERKFGSEGIIHSQLDSYTEATQFSFAPWDQKGPTAGLIPFSDLDEWLEDQKATTARTAKAKGKKSARVKKKAGPGAGRIFDFTGRSRKFNVKKTTFSSSIVPAATMADAILAAVKGKSVALPVSFDVFNLSVESYDKVADATDAGIISSVTLAPGHLVVCADELLRHQDITKDSVTREELVDLMEGDAELRISFYADVVYGGGYITPSVPDTVEFDDKAECIVDFKPATVRMVAADVEEGVFELSEEMRYAFESLEFDDDDFMAEDEDLHQARTARAAKAKPAKLQKKADAGNGVVYFEIHTADYAIEEDQNSDDPEAQIRLEEFMRGHENQKGMDALTRAALAEEDVLRRHIQKALTKALGRNVTVNDEGHDSYGNLVCKFSVNSTEELLKARDAISPMYGSEGIIDTVCIYTEARQFSFAPWDQKGPTAGLIPFSDLDEWLEDQQAKTARKASAKGKKSAGVKKTASLKWDDKGQNVWVAENVEIRLSTYSGKPRSMRVSLRIDGRRGNEFRVDVGATTGWEAIDEGPTRAPKTLEDAKALAERWVAAANEQGTLSPSDYKSAKVKTKPTAKSARKVKRATSIDYDTIVENYALALWASEFASAVDRAIEDGVLKRAPWSGGDIIEDYCPEMPADYLNAVEQHLGALKSSNPDIPGGAAGIEQDFLAYREATGNDEEKYGYQLSMQHQGSGVSTSDDGHFETAFGGYPLEHSGGYIEVAEDGDDTKVLYTLNASLKGSYVDFTVDATSELSYCLA